MPHMSEFALTRIKVEKRLEEEYERTVHCLSMTTEIKIRTIVETQLIANNLKTLMEV